MRKFWVKWVSETLRGIAPEPQHRLQYRIHAGVDTVFTSLHMSTLNVNGCSYVQTLFTGYDRALLPDGGCLTGCEYTD